MLAIGIGSWSRIMADISRSTGAEVRFLRSIEENPKRYTIRNEKLERIGKLKTLGAN
jgi:hypothetical protein